VFSYGAICVCVNLISSLVSDRAAVLSTIKLMTRKLCTSWFVTHILLFFALRGGDLDQILFLT